MSFRVLSRHCGCREDAESGQTTKTIIFCTFTKALDLMQKRLDKAGARWVRLDGKMRLSQRTEATREFALNPEVGREPDFMSICLHQSARCVMAQASICMQSCMLQRAAPGPRTDVKSQEGCGCLSDLLLIPFSVRGWAPLK